MSTPTPEEKVEKQFNMFFNSQSGDDFSNQRGDFMIAKALLLLNNTLDHQLTEFNKNFSEFNAILQNRSNRHL